MYFLHIGERAKVERHKGVRAKGGKVKMSPPPLCPFTFTPFYPSTLMPFHPYALLSHVRLRCPYHL